MTDAERIDFLDQMAHEGYYPTTGYLNHGHGFEHKVEEPYYYIIDPVQEEESTDYWIGKGKTLREAIDDAADNIKASMPKCNTCGGPVEKLSYNICDSCMNKWTVAQASEEI